MRTKILEVLFALALIFMGFVAGALTLLYYIPRIQIP